MKNIIGIIVLLVLAGLVRLYEMNAGEVLSFANKECGSLGIYVPGLSSSNAGDVGFVPLGVVRDEAKLVEVQYTREYMSTERSSAPVVEEDAGVVVEEDAGVVVEEDVSADSPRMRAVVLAYQVVVEKYPLSFASLKAKEQLALIGAETGIYRDGRFVMTFMDWCFPWAGPYDYCGFPFLVCAVCSVVLVISLLFRFRFGKPVALVVVLIVVAVGLFMFQLIDAGVCRVPPSVDVGFIFRSMENPRWLYGVCYALSPICVLVFFGSFGRRSILAD